MTSRLTTRPFGSTGLTVSALGIGASEIRAAEATDDTVDRLLTEALDAGVNVIDTAECYGDSEEKLGRTLGVGGRRGRFHLFTKVGHEHGWSAGEDYSAAAITRTIDRSLSRLRTDHVELVQLHSCGVETLSRGECIEALERARQQGKTRFIGYSGDNEAAAFAVATGRFDTLQTTISIADQLGIDRWVADAARRDMGIIAKRPIANAAWIANLQPGAYGHEYVGRLHTLGYPFLSRPASESAALALRFTLSVPGVHTAIVGTIRPGRVADNARVLAAGPLSAADYAAIRSRWSQVAEPSWVGLT
ncbi:MAG: aldo/keto reductase [Phycisphaerales bacterium]